LQHKTSKNQKKHSKKYGCEKKESQKKNRREGLLKVSRPRGEQEEGKKSRTYQTFSDPGKSEGKFTLKNKKKTKKMGLGATKTKGGKV